MKAEHNVHAVSKNASDIEPATFLVFIIKDKNVPATIPVHVEQ